MDAAAVGWLRTDGRLRARARERRRQMQEAASSGQKSNDAVLGPLILAAGDVATGNGDDKTAFAAELQAEAAATQILAAIYNCRARARGQRPGEEKDVLQVTFQLFCPCVISKMRFTNVHLFECMAGPPRVPFGADGRREQPPDLLPQFGALRWRARL
jgi:hypothetical protein